MNHNSWKQPRKHKISGRQPERYPFEKTSSSTCQRFFLLLIIGMGLIYGINQPIISYPQSTIITNVPAVDKISPYDRIKESQVHLFKNKVTIDIQSPQLGRIGPTKSMDPVFDETSNTIYVVPKTKDEVFVGDIVLYQTKPSGQYDYNFVKRSIIHRVIAIGEDKQGWYAILKGDNNTFPDDDRVKFNQIQGVVVAVLY